MEFETSGSSKNSWKNIEDDVNKASTVDKYRNPTVLLVEESTLTELPIHLVKILEQMNKQQITSSDLLFCVLYSLALEIGFVYMNVTNDEYESHSLNWGYSFDYKNVIKFARLPENISLHYGQVHNVQLKMPALTDEVFQLMSLRTGDSVIINLTSRNKSRPGRSICLSLVRFVPVINIKCFPRCFRHLNDLSIKMKNEIFLPIRNELYLEAGHLYPGLSGLYPDLIFHLIKYLDDKTRIKLAMTCRTLCNIGIKQ